jgi:rare lipoprotein A
MLARAALPLTAFLLLLPPPAQSQSGDSDAAILFSPAPMDRLERRFERTAAPIFTRPDVYSAVSGMSAPSEPTASASSHKGAGAVLRELLLVSPAEGASSSTQPSSQPFAQQHRPPASAFAEQEAVEREEQATGSTETSTPARRPLWAKRAPPPTATRTRPQPLGIARAAFYEHPGRTASGEKYNPDGLTAAHKTLPLGTRLRVVNQRNGRSVVVRINDRVPRQAKFPIDLSRGSARAIGMSSVAPVILYAMR